MLDQHGNDLVVMGTHGRSGLSRRLLGSVIEQDLRNSDELILTIRGV
ncbi:universal stress protein [Halorubrum sp. Atlit-8R]